MMSWKVTEQEVMTFYRTWMRKGIHSNGLDSFEELFRPLSNLKRTINNHKKLQDVVDRLYHAIFEEFVWKCTREGLCPKDILQKFNKEYMNVLPDLFMSSRRSEETRTFFQELNTPEHIADVQEEFYHTLIPPSLLYRAVGEILRQEDGLRLILEDLQDYPDSERADVFQRILLEIVSDPFHRKYPYYCTLWRSVREILGDQETRMDQRDLKNVVRYLLTHGIRISKEDCETFRKKYPDLSSPQYMEAWLNFISGPR